MVWIVRAEYVSGHKVRLEFSGGTIGIVDLYSEFATDHRPIFQELRDAEAFRRFHVENDTVTWDNGLDLAPEFLHELLMTQTAHDRA